MSIDTTITGDPAGIRAVSDWLRDRLAPSATAAADSFHSARNTALAGWQSPAGEAFVHRIGQDARGADDLAAAAGTSARDVDELAAELQHAQSEMGEIRAAAAEAGLAVQGNVIVDPGPPAPDPGPGPGPNAPVEVQQAHADTVAAAQRQNTAVEAYRHAGRSADAVGNRWLEVIGRIGARVGQDIRDKWFISLGDVGNVVGAWGAATQTKILTGRADDLRTQAARYLENTTRPGAELDRRLFYRDLDDAGRLGREADAVAVRADRARGYDGTTGLKLGGGLAVAGIVYDVAVNDKPAVQAVASGAGGFAAGVGAGFVLAGTYAAFGSTVGPVGTVVGGLIGLGVGMFASGAIDEMFENGPSISGVAGAGWDAVEGAGRAVGDLATDAWDAIF